MKPLLVGGRWYMLGEVGKGDLDHGIKCWKLSSLPKIEFTTPTVVTTTSTPRIMNGACACISLWNIGKEQTMCVFCCEASSHKKEMGRF